MYPGTGHLLEPPYLPVCPINYHSVFSKCLFKILSFFFQLEKRKKATLQSPFPFPAPPTIWTLDLDK